MRQWSRDEIMKGLRELVTEIEYLEKADDIDSKSGGIHTTSEDACIFKGIPPFNHDLEYGELMLSDAGYTDDKHRFMKVKEMYTYGIHHEIYSWLEERGWYPEWYDRVSLYFWKRTEDSDDEIIENLENYQIYLDIHEIDGIEGQILQKLRESFEEKNE
ncbi:MAG: hypothetical protein HOD60_09550 [Candidatus Nitrosopelagicus sp.]|nr:hypothetical protein [Candidatus Nitrosopelagicus sp.]